MLVRYEIPFPLSRKTLPFLDSKKIGLFSPRFISIPSYFYWKMKSVSFHPLLHKHFINRSPPPRHRMNSQGAETPTLQFSSLRICSPVCFNLGYLRDSSRPHPHDSLSKVRIRYRRQTTPHFLPRASFSPANQFTSPGPKRSPTRPSRPMASLIKGFLESSFPYIDLANPDAHNH